MPEEIKAKIVFDTSGLAGALSGVGGSLGSASGGMMKAGAMAGAVAAGVSGLVSVMKKGFEALKSASPRLQATMSIAMKGLMMILRPIGDVISVFIRPLAMQLLRYGINFYKNFKVWQEEIFGKFMSKKETAEPTGAGASAPSELSNILATIVSSMELLVGQLTALWGVLKGIAGIVLMVGQGFLFLLDVALTPFMPLIESLGERFMVLGEFFSSIGSAIWDLATGGSWTAFLKSVSDAWTKYTKDMLVISTKFTDAFKAQMGLIWDVVKTVWDVITGFIQSKFEILFFKIKDMFTKIIEWIQNLIPSRRGSGSSTKETSVQDAIITPSGIVYTDPNDFIIATKDPSSLGGGGGNVTINVSVNALDASSINSGVLNNIANAISDRMRTELSMRTTERNGI